MRRELKRFQGTSKIALVFMLLLPLLYSAVYLHANWDLYSKIDSLDVAIVNQDKPVKMGETLVSGGKQVEDNLRKTKGFKWNFVGANLEAAQQDMRAGKYYLIIHIPEEFSKDLTSAGSFEAKRAQIHLYRDDANGFVAGMMTSQMEALLGKALDEAVSETYFKTLFISLDEVKDGLNQAAEGAGKLDDALQQVGAGIHQINSGLTNVDLTKLQEHLSQVQTSIHDVNQVLPRFYEANGDIRTGLASLTGVVESQKSDIANLQLHLQPISNWLDAKLTGSHKDAIELVSLNAELLSPAESSLTRQLNRNLAEANAATSQLSTLQLADGTALADHPQFQKLVENLDKSQDLQNGIEKNLRRQGQLSSKLSIDLNPALLDTAVRAIDDARDSLGRSAKQLETAKHQFQSGGNKLNQTLEDFHLSLKPLQTASSGSLQQIPKAINGFLQLQSGLAKLDTVMPQITAGSSELSTKLAAGAAKIPGLSEDSRNALAKTMASPVEVTSQVDNSAEYYGRGLAPFFLTIALWVTAISMFLVLRTVSGRALTGRASAVKLAWAGISAPLALGVGGSLLMGLALWPTLGMNPVNPGAYLLLLVVAAAAYVALAFLTRLYLGSGQSAVFIIALLLQLPASGGTFPIAMLEPFYRALGVISPMRYTVDAFRVAISGGNMTIYWQSIAVLAGMFIVCLPLIVHKIKQRKIFTFQDLHPKFVTSNATGDYAFSIHPR